MGEQEVLIPTLQDPAQWDGKRFRFYIGAEEHDGPELLSRIERKRNNGGTRYKFCQEHFSWSCLPRREVQGSEALLFAQASSPHILNFRT